MENNDDVEFRKKYIKSQKTDALWIASTGGFFIVFGAIFFYYEYDYIEDSWPFGLFIVLLGIMWLLNGAISYRQWSRK